jgi:hypothetical protein
MADGPRRAELLRFIQEATEFVSAVMTPEERQDVAANLADASSAALTLRYPEAEQPEQPNTGGPDGNQEAGEKNSNESH